MMDRLDIVRYYFIILKVYRQLERGIIRKGFGTKSNWAKELEPAKFRDKSVWEFVNQMIDKGILKEKSTNERGDMIYQPDEDGAKLVQKQAEESEIARIWTENGYADLKRIDYDLLFSGTLSE